MLDNITSLQSEKVAELTRKFKSDTKTELTFKSPTGSGKTRMMADFMNRILSEEDVVFIVSCLSKGELYRQNYNSFLKYRDEGFAHLNPCLITSDDSSEGEVFIPNGYNVYILPRDLYKDKSLLMQGGLKNFLERIHNSTFGLGKTIYLIRDECHQATNNLDGLKAYFSKTVNFSATPDEKKGQIPDVTMTEIEAQDVNLIKKVTYKDDVSLEEALLEFLDIKEKYNRDVKVVNPCLIIQISNTGKAEKEIEEVISTVDGFGLRYIYMTGSKSKKSGDYRTNCTNDSIKKLHFSKWEEYAKSPGSLIDVIIFKLKISEGWDIPRACMLYQVRETQSKQLDEQVIGRVRRNPCITQFDKFPKDIQSLLMNAVVFNVKFKDSRIPRQIKSVPDCVKVKTTRLQNLSKSTSFDVSSLIKPSVASQSIFSLYKDFQRTSPDVKSLFRSYGKDKTDIFSFLNNLKPISEAVDGYQRDYSRTMEQDSEVSFSGDSYFMDTASKKLQQSTDSWVWKRTDGDSVFEFDSEAEKAWAKLLMDNIDSIAERLNTLDGNTVYLFGKNFYPNSKIKYEYYLNGVHSSYPDFILKDKYERIHIFEIKSITKKAVSQIDEQEYMDKINALKDCYLEASKKTGHCFYIPVFISGMWEIHRFISGRHDTIDAKTCIQDIKFFQN